ncbi:MAG: hypothetical protein DMF83_20355 [Acidobacteria bacterium]|nr:MAG: hypothetical protein DMF83_20355 [Acidobacteriota bacterium]
MAKGFRVRLDDGSEMDLDSDMVRSWYDQGLIQGDTPMRAPGSKNWRRMDEVVEMRGWKESPGRAGSDDDEEAAGPAGPQKWRSYVASALLFAAAAGAGYMSFFPERWTPALAPVPWREIALGALVLALSLIRGWPIGRVFARVVMLLGAFALFPLAGLLIAQGVRGLPLLVLLSAWVVASGFFAFLGAVVATANAILFLVTILLGAAGVYYFGYVPPGTAPAASVTVSAPAPTAPPPTLSAAPASAPPGLTPSAGSAPDPGTALAVRAATQEIPLLSPRAAELLMSKSAAHILEPPEVFRRAYGLVGRGLYALSKSESKEMGDLHTALYASLPPDQRERLGEYIDRARNRYATTPEEDRRMSQLMKSAVLSLPADKRARLQALFEKALTAGLDKP